MSVDEDFETVLRQQFCLQEPQVGATADLTTRVLTDGHREISRRRTRLAVGAGVGATALAVAVGITALQVASSPENERSLTTSERQSSDPTEKKPLAEWAAGLPRGARPEVAYVAGTAVHLPDGAVTELDVADVTIIGQSVAGLIIFVEKEDAQGVMTGSSFVLVRDDGSILDMQTSTEIAGAAQEALVSPDGRYFTNGDQVVDKSTGTSIGEMPEEADILISWTSSGIIYQADGQDYYLWRLGEVPIALDGFPGRYDVGTDVGLRGTKGPCTEVVRIGATGKVTPIGAGCVPDLLSVSPDGTTGVTTDLRVIDLATAEASPLSDTPLDNAYGYVDIHWLNDEDFLVSVPASTDNRRSSLVRCRTNELRCEAATGAVGVGDNGSALLP